MTKPERLFEAQLYDAMSGEWHTVHAEECDHMRGCYYVIVDNDPEHTLNASAVGREAAQAEVDEALFQLADSLDVTQFVTYNAAGKNS